MLTMKRFVLLTFMFWSGAMVASNVWILNKVKPEDGASIYVEISYFPIWSPLIPIKKTAELRYNEELTLLGSPRIQWIRIRNAKEEFDVDTAVQGSVQTTARRQVLSRITNITGDSLIDQACSEYVAANSQKYGGWDLDRAKSAACSSGFLLQTGAHLKNNAIEINQVLNNVLLPIALAVTRVPGTRNFIVSELKTGITGREPFYYYVKGKDLSVKK